MSFHELYICCQETREKLLHMINRKQPEKKNKNKEPDKKVKAREPDRKSKSSKAPSGQVNSFFSEDEDNDIAFDGSVMKDIEMVLAEDDETVRGKKESNDKEEVYLLEI